MLLVGVELKFVPVIITVVPMGPEAGLNEVIVGGTINVPAFTVLHPIVTSSGPDVAPTGIVTVRVVAIGPVIVPGTPLNVTAFEKGVLKFVPVMVTEVPTAPNVGAKEVMVGGEISPITFREIETVRTLVTKSVFPSPSISP